LHSDQGWAQNEFNTATNKTLKSLSLTIKYGSTSSCLSSFRIDIATMLVKNLSLENLSIRSWHEIIAAEDYAALITTLQHNTTLKTLEIREEQIPSTSVRLTADEENQMALLLKEELCVRKHSGH
jgi:hypothetical protein